MDAEDSSLGPLRSEPAPVAIDVQPGELATASITISPGWNLVSVPIQPAALHPYGLADLCRDCGSTLAVYTRPANGDTGGFHVWSAGSSAANPMAGPTQAYLIREIGRAHV